MTDIKIIYEDTSLLVINKPAGLLIHTTTSKRANTEETLVNCLVSKYPDIRKVGENALRPGIVHRLDKDTSGVIVIAKNQETFEYLKSQFQNGLIAKTYRALIFGSPKNDTGVIEGVISLKPGTTKHTVHKGKMPKPAVTEYRVLERFENVSFIEVYPKTCKKLFIPKLNRQMLHAYKIEFESPNGKKLMLTADQPEDFEAVLQYFRKTPKLQ